MKPNTVKCPYCENGQLNRMSMRECPNCRGEGIIETITRKEIAFHAKICDATIVRNESKWGLNQAISGNLITKPRLYDKAKANEILLALKIFSTPLI